jgi:carbonic anhydrase
MDLQSSIGRRKFFRLGAAAALATAASPLITQSLALAGPMDEVCNEGAPTNPVAALAALKKGNLAWANNDQTHPGEDPARRECLANNPQTPFASILSCSDSRCPPELLFDQGLGDLFVARVAGNTASGRLIDSLLFGTQDLGSQLLFVLGHTSCGAVAAAVNTWPNPFPRLPFVELIYPAVVEAREIVEERGGDPTDPDQVIPVATIQNVIITVGELREYFGLSAKQVAGGVYDLASQKVKQVA